MPINNSDLHLKEFWSKRFRLADLSSVQPFKLIDSKCAYAHFHFFSILYRALMHTFILWKVEFHKFTNKAHMTIFIEYLTRAKNIQERILFCETHASFEIAVLFPLPCRWGEKGGNFKTNMFFTEANPFLYCLSSNYNHSDTEGE